MKNSKTAVIVATNSSKNSTRSSITSIKACINSEVSMTRSDDNKVAIINCEHEYWKTGKNYKEWILPETFYTP